MADGAHTIREGCIAQDLPTRVMAAAARPLPNTSDLRPYCEQVHL